MKPAVVALMLLAVLGCDRRAAVLARPTVAPGPCTITGTVRFSGPRPPVDPPTGQCCPGVPRPADERVVVNPNGTLRDVTIYVEAGPNLAGPPPPYAVLAQRGCRYDPHTLALTVGQKVVVTNGDPTPHNVDYHSTANGKDNFPEFPAASRPIVFDHPDDDVVFRCDIHPWMLAHAMVFDNPCHAVSGPDGTFRLDHLPPGTYTVVAHHDEFEDQRQTVTVTAAAPTAAVTFDYHP